MTGEGARWLEVLAPERLADQAIICVRVEAVDLLLIRDGERIMACERAFLNDSDRWTRGGRAGGYNQEKARCQRLYPECGPAHHR
jgi:hypothetical protein